ncbi:hypothetical protein BJX64DRAFT_262056 [Aspergillus heterothallicus]
MGMVLFFSLCNIMTGVEIRHGWFCFFVMVMVMIMMMISGFHSVFGSSLSSLVENMGHVNSG